MSWHPIVWSVYLVQKLLSLSVWLLNLDKTSFIGCFLLVAIVEGSQLLNNIDHHFITSWYKTRQLLLNGHIFVHTITKETKKTTKGNHMYMLLPTWRKEMNLPICICNSPSTTLVSDTVTKLHIKLFWFKMKNKSNEKCKIFWCRGAG